ncbi:MAG: arabinogalactan endo-1,4-beta-galactosidase [Myxococcota bacterium]|nr:arabinogalactan endo-1,4-beta-galactosidase [Myxococcota bacterium]
MTRSRFVHTARSCVEASLLALLIANCSSQESGSEPNPPSTGGNGSGGAASTATGGALVSSGGASPSGGAGFTGGASVTGGRAASGGGRASSGGAAPETGGSPAMAGATASGGATANGGKASGGSSNSGGSISVSGGATNGGSGGSVFDPAFILGADISSVQEGKATFEDTDGRAKTIFELLKNHGFNYIRLKTFVDPDAPYGYSSKENGCSGFDEPFGDKAHVIAFGKQAKDAGMGFLLDFHYSDTWADPGNQIIPDPWRGASNIGELAGFVKAYTKDVIASAVAAGARPDMVQIGNEITPGMLMHVPGASTDCWGNNPERAPVGGGTGNWDNLAALLKAGIEGVREVDAGIQIMLHVENTDDLAGVRRWVDSALARDVDFDVLGLSCYVAFQGAPSVWKATFTDLASRYPDLKFAIAEYNPEREQANRIMKELPNGRGLGTFFWEPTRSGEWGDALFDWQGNTGTAKQADFAVYDGLREYLGI